MSIECCELQDAGFSECGTKRLRILACPGATPRWDARQRINQVWARDCGMRNTGLGNCGIKIKNPKSKIQNVITKC